MNKTRIRVENVGNGGAVIGNAEAVHAQTVNVYAPGMEDSVTDYYTQLATDCKLHTVHTAIGDDAPSGVSPRTAQVYVTPDVSIAVTGSKNSKSESGAQEIHIRVPLTDCLASTEPSFQRIVLTASSGMGKTTTVNMQVVALAKSGSAPWMVLRLPALLGLDFSGAKLVEKALERDIQLKLTKSADDSATIARELIKRLDAQPGVILFDALDEVPEAERPRVLSAVTEFLDDRSDEQSGHRVVLTSRPYAYQGASLLQLAVKGFTRVELASFTPEQRDELIDQYFSKVVNSTETGNAMKRQVASSANDDIATLLAEPMLLTYGCMLAAARAEGEAIGGAKFAAPLPNTRYKLFDGLVSLMLEKWDSRRELDEVKPFEVLFDASGGRSALRKILEQAAYWEATWEATQRRVVRENQISPLDGPKILLSHDTLVTLTDDAMPCDLPVRAGSVVDWLAERSGLVRRVQESGRMGYQLHKQLASFLAVGELRALCKDDHEFAQRLIETMRSDPEWFRQFLAMGLARLADNPRALENARDTVLQFPKGDDREPVAAPRCWEALAVFAIARHEAVPANLDGMHLVPETNKDRERALLLELIETQRLTPVLRAEVADALGAMGDPRFDESHLFLPNDRFKGHTPLQEPIPGFVLIPAGPFWMGHDTEAQTNDKGETTNDNPSREVKIAKPFYVARTLTTVDQFALFVDDEDYVDAVRTGARGDAKKAGENWRTPSDWVKQREFGNRPAVGVNWFQARAYARWLDARLRQETDSALAKLSGYEVRLPNEAQWERAARATGLGAKDVHADRWPYGATEQTLKDFANIRQSGIERVSSVGVFLPTAIGLSDIVGNAWQWMDNEYLPRADDRFPTVTDAAEGAAMKDPGKQIMSLRGGSWILRPVHASCSYGIVYPPGNWDLDVGFRVVLSLASSSEA